MLQITSTEFKKNLGKYRTIVSKEDIVITRNGVPIAQVTVPKDRAVSLVSQLTGAIAYDGYTAEGARRKKLKTPKSNHYSC